MSFTRPPRRGFLPAARSPPAFAVLGERDQQHVVHPRVVAPEDVAGVDTASAGLADDLLRGSSDANGKLLECCLFCKHESRPRRSFACSASAMQVLPHLLEPLRPEPREVDEPARRQQRLVGGDVGGRLLAPDVLLARLEGEDIAALPAASVVSPTMRPGIRRMKSMRAARNP
jgi:hypothetical protein